MSGVNKPNLRSRLKSDSVTCSSSLAGKSTPPTPHFYSGKRGRSATPLSSRARDDVNIGPDLGWDHLQSVVEKAVSAALVKERHSYSEILEVKLTAAMETERRKISDILDEKLGMLHDLEVAIDTKLHQLRGVEATLETSSAKLKDLETRMDHIDQYSRRNSIRLLGVKATPGEDTNQIAIDIAKQIGVDIKPDSIDRSHRTPARISQDQSQSRNTSHSRPPPIIVKFVSYQSKFQMFSNRRKLKGSGVVIVEDLSKKNLDLLKRTSRHPRVMNSWSIDGRIFALIQHDDGKTSKKLIKSVSDLNALD